MTIAGTITDTGTGNSITVNDNDANTAPNIVTFSGTVAADTLYIGTATTAGHAKFTGTTGPTITSITITGGNHADEDSTATFNYALTSTDITLDDNTGDAYLIFAENNSVTIAGTIDGAANGEGNLQITGTLKTFSNNIGDTYYLGLIDIDTNVTFSGDVTTYRLQLGADINDSGDITVEGPSTIETDVISQGPQIYNGDITITTNVSLDSNNNKITFNGTVNSQSSEANTLTIDVGSSEVEFNGIVGGALNGGLGAIDITGALNLDAAITSAASLTVSTTTNLAANVTTAGTQTYGDGISSGAVVLSTDVTLTTTDSNITFNGTVRSDSSDTPRDLTINLDANSNGTTADLIINGIVGGNSLPLDVISITGDLDLNSSIGNSPGATSITVSGDANLGADVETTGTQTYSGAVTISNDITLTTTNSNVSFGATTNAGTAGDTLTIAAGSGDVTFTDAVGGSTAMGNITITTGALSAAAIKVQGTIDITNTDTSSITGIISDGASSAIVTKAGSGTLTLSANNTYTGQTNINAGIISITDNNSLGTTAGATIVADGASLSISNDITSAENITISGTGISSNGAIRNTADDNTLTGLITLGAHSEIQIDTGSSLTLNPTSGSAVTGTYNLTIESVGTSSINDPIATSTGNIIKTGAGTLTLSGTNTYSGNTTISAGTIKLTGSVNALTDLSIASGATLDLQSTQTFATLDLDGTISNSAGSSELTITGASDH